jgi:hypothetical protein
MTNPAPLLLLLLGAAILGWLWTAQQADDSPDWQIRAESPQLIGEATDPFSYAGGEGVRPVIGTVFLRLDGSDGEIQATIESSEPNRPLRLPDSTVDALRWEITSTIDGPAEIWTETAVHGDTGLGDPRLPETTARLAGWSRFDIVIDGNQRRSGLIGFWSVADALRQEDGAIRQRGLVFSPLLREKSGFSDPSRLECTLLLYEAERGSDPLVHLVFSDVTIERTGDDEATTNRSD